MIYDMIWYILHIIPRGSDKYIVVAKLQLQHDKKGDKIMKMRKILSYVLMVEIVSLIMTPFALTNLLQQKILMLFMSLKMGMGLIKLQI